MQDNINERTGDHSMASGYTLLAAHRGFANTRQVIILAETI
ncbi:MAG: hypothetical protein QNL87_11235 [Gammaproteobacteria bacterium]|nr:hypothetical protein [Gammaproteobacteria bacterium]